MLLSRLLISASALILLIDPSLAQTAGFPDLSSWAELTDDASRQDSFKTHVVLSSEEIARTTTNVVGFAIPTEFIFANDATFDKIQNHERKGAIFGIDISHYTDPSLAPQPQRGYHRKSYYARPANRRSARQSSSLSGSVRCRSESSFSLMGLGTLFPNRNRMSGVCMKRWTKLTKIRLYIT
jgi:hypothetical protein